MIYNLIVILDNQDEDMFVLSYSTLPLAEAGVEEMHILHGEEGILDWGISGVEVDQSMLEYRVLH